MRRARRLRQRRRQRHPGGRRLSWMSQTTMAAQSACMRAWQLCGGRGNCVTGVITATHMGQSSPVDPPLIKQVFLGSSVL